MNDYESKRLADLRKAIIAASEVYGDPNPSEESIQKTIEKIEKTRTY